MKKNRFNGNALFSNKHIKRIKYGNEIAKYFETSPYLPLLPTNDNYFFELVFDYGEHGTKDNPTFAETTAWKARADAFSSFRSCFDMRTYRLCERVLMFHKFTELGNEPTLVRSINFDYKFSSIYGGIKQDNAEVTYLTAIEQIGYVKTGATYSQKSLPKMAFAYQELTWNKDIKTVSSENLVHAPIGLSGNYQWTDLYSEGINGILTEQANGWFYKSNLGQDTEGGTKPSRVVSIVRETHFKTINENGVLVENPTKYQISIEYSDGLGNVALKKVQAEGGKAFHVDKNASGECQKTELVLEIRWIGNGRTVLNNKGKPIKQYEPYFSDTHQYEDADCVRQIGVTPILFYDAVGRNIKTELPDGTFTKVEFDAWEQRSFDQNDNTLNSVHFNTPSIIYLDSLGRPFFSIAHNKWIVRGDSSRPEQRFEEFYPTYVTLDIEGNVYEVIDARNNAVMTYKYDMLGHRLYQKGMDNGERWMLNDCMGKPVQGWDVNDIRNPDGSRAWELRVLTTNYDLLHRPIDTFLWKNTQYYKIEHIEYGTDATYNLVGQIYKHQDGSGQTRNVRYDFKGNLLETQKQMPSDAKAEIVNLETAVLKDETFTLITEYDALNRMNRLYNWHRQDTIGAIYVPQYNARGVYPYLFASIGSCQKATG